MKYVIDIDGTICKEEGDVIGREPYLDRIKQINKLYDNGHTIVYMTARGLKSGRGETYYRVITEEQLKLWGSNARIRIKEKCSLNRNVSVLEKYLLRLKKIY